MLSFESYSWDFTLAMYHSCLCFLRQFLIRISTSIHIIIIKPPCCTENVTKFIFAYWHINLPYHSSHWNTFSNKIFIAIFNSSKCSKYDNFIYSRWKLIIVVKILLAFMDWCLSIKHIVNILILIVVFKIDLTNKSLCTFPLKKYDCVINYSHASFSRCIVN